jgi:hypothetical protein
MIIPFVAMLAIVAIVVLFIVKSGKHPDQGNKPGR